MVQNQRIFLTKGSCLVLTRSPWFSSILVQAAGKKAGSLQKNHLELWHLQRWSLHSQSHHRAGAQATAGEWRWDCLFCYQVMLHAVLNCSWLYSIACTYYKHNPWALGFIWLQQEVLLDRDISEHPDVAPVGHLGSHLVKWLLLTKLGTPADLLVKWVQTDLHLNTFQFGD